MTKSANNILTKEQIRELAHARTSGKLSNLSIQDFELLDKMYDETFHRELHAIMGKQKKLVYEAKKIYEPN